MDHIPYFTQRRRATSNVQKQRINWRRKSQQRPMDQFFDLLVLTDAALGYKVTLQPELSNAQVAIAASPRRPQVYPNLIGPRQETHYRTFGRPTQIRRISGEQVFRRYGQQPRRYPIVETILEAVAEASRAERIAQPSSSTEHHNGNTQTVCNASVDLQGTRNSNADTNPTEISPRRRRWNGRERRQRRRRRRRGARRYPEARRNQTNESDESMYEVLDVDYEKITDLGKAEPPKDWRIIPRYELTAKEVAQQERDLFFSMTRDERPEESQMAKDGEPRCCVCFENVATRVVIPCGHRCLCHDCAFNIATSRSIFGGKRLAKLCPICQAAIAVIPRLC